MTRSLTLAAAITLIAAGAMAQQPPEPTQPQNVAPTQPAQAAPSNEGRAPAADDMQQQTDRAERAMQSKSGEGGKEEPGSHVPTTKPSEAGTENTAAAQNPQAQDPVMQNPQTTPSKYSERNAALDKLPIMARPVPLTDAQRRRIYTSVSETKPEPASEAVEPAHTLSADVALHPLPKKITEEIPALGNLHYAKFANKVLLVRAPNRIVIDVIEK